MHLVMCIPSISRYVLIHYCCVLDEWPIKELSEEIPQHTNVDERVSAACKFLNQYRLHPKFTLAIDSFENEFVNVYCSWPFRYWVIQHGIIRLKSMPKGDSVSLKALWFWLMKFCCDRCA